MGCMRTPDLERSVRLAEFNKELGRRLASLDRGEQVNPEELRAHFRRKAEDRGTSHSAGDE